MLRGLFAAALLVAGCDPVPPISCPIGYLGIASKIPLNSQADCAGYSRVNNEQSLGIDGLCAPLPDEPASLTCFREACCIVVATACLPDGGPDLDANTCGDLSIVSTCRKEALERCSADAGDDAGPDACPDVGDDDGGCAP